MTVNITPELLDYGMHVLTHTYIYGDGDDEDRRIVVEKAYCAVAGVTYKQVTDEMLDKGMQVLLPAYYESTDRRTLFEATCRAMAELAPREGTM